MKAGLRVEALVLQLIEERLKVRRLDLRCRQVGDFVGAYLEIPEAGAVDSPGRVSGGAAVLPYPIQEEVHEVARRQPTALVVLLFVR